MGLRFEDLEFGSAAAETEASERPELLLEGFLDPKNYTDKILEDRHFLILGPKGSGKSALASRFGLLAEKDRDFFTKNYLLKDFPYSTFTGLVPGSDPPEVKYPRTWEYLLLVCILESLSEDESSRLEGHRSLHEILERMRTVGILPAEELRKVVKKSSKKKVRTGIPKIFELSLGKEIESGRPDVRNLREALQDIVYSIEVENDHFIFIDGLDDALTNREAQYQSLGSLLLAADRVNRKLREEGSPIKVVVLCRTDLLEILPDPNTNKIRQDFSITLDWYQDAKERRSTNLAKLINLRARLSTEEEIDVFEDLLPPTVYGADPTIKTLLEHSRHRPRDMIQLINKVKKHTRGRHANPRDVKAGIRGYSEDFFLPELRNELSGFLGQTEIDEAFEILSQIGKKQFEYGDVEELCGDYGLEPKPFCRNLFEANAIGMIQQIKGKARFSFRFRNKHIPFNPNHTIVVHKGLHKALNLM